MLRPFRDPAIAHGQFRTLVASLSAHTTQESMRDTAAQYTELNVVNFPGNTRVFLLPRAREWDWSASLLYMPDGRLFYAETHLLDSGAPIPGVPKERCFIPESECKRAVGEWRAARKDRR
jgi:hypothetical protein